MRHGARGSAEGLPHTVDEKELFLVDTSSLAAKEKKTLVAPMEVRPFIPLLPGMPEVAEEDED